MRQSTSLNEAEIKAFTDQALFATPTQKGSTPLIAMWVIAGAVMATVLTVGIFTILTCLSINQKMILLGHDLIKAVTYR